MTETFNVAATNEDKLLNEAQFIDFCQKCEANNEAKGWTMPKQSEAYLKKCFTITNSITPGSEGVSIMDVWFIMGKRKEIMNEVKTEMMSKK